MDLEYCIFTRFRTAMLLFMLRKHPFRNNVTRIYHMFYPNAIPLVHNIVNFYESEADSDL